MEILLLLLLFTAGSPLARIVPVLQRVLNEDLVMSEGMSR